MSHLNVEIVQRVLDAWNRRDLETLLALSNPEIEYVNSPTAVEPGTRRGFEGITAVWQTQWEILLDGRLETDRIYDRGEEIVVLGRLSRRMPEGDARIEDQYLISWTIRDGKVVRSAVLGFGRTEVAKGLEAAGLRE
jgi:ketosteroid isomerase-like protein